MMHYDLEHLMWDRHHTFLADADRRRLAALARKPAESRLPARRAVLAGFGRLLVDWGEHLQTRYGEACHQIQPRLRQYR